MKDIYEIYSIIIEHKTKVAFVGKETIKNYLCYVVGNDVQMKCYAPIDTKNINEDIVIVDDVTEKNGMEHFDGAVKLSKFVEALNTVSIPKNRKVALWGGGIELEKKIGMIKKYCTPSLIIDKKKVGEYEGISFVSPEEIEFQDYFIIITTTKFASEVREELISRGCVEGVDFILGSNPAFLNDNAEMFIQAITAKPLKKINCRRPFDYVNVGVGGNLTHCCYEWLPKYIGNVLNNEDNNYDTISSRIIRISFMNQTYAFCNSVCCPWMSKERDKLFETDIESIDEELYMQPQKVVDVDVAFDNTCNLFCESCRKDFIIDKSDEPIQIAKKISNDLIPYTRRLTVAGNGEAFLSKAYAVIFEGSYPDTCLTILSNGNLFTMGKWKNIEGHFKNVTMMFSIDAATKETYEKVRRGGNWENVIRGLTVASQLRQEEKIQRFIIRFVVSRKNYMEMPDFVKLGLDINCDVVDFSRIENWGTFTDEEFENVSMFVGDTPKKELRDVLSLPIMNTAIVKYTNI